MPRRKLRSATPPMRAVRNRVHRNLRPRRSRIVRRSIVKLGLIDEYQLVVRLRRQRAGSLHRFVEATQFQARASIAIRCDSAAVSACVSPARFVSLAFYLRRSLVQVDHGPLHGNLPSFGGRFGSSSTVATRRRRRSVCLRQRKDSTSSGTPAAYPSRAPVAVAYGLRKSRANLQTFDTSRLRASARAIFAPLITAGELRTIS